MTASEERVREILAGSVEERLVEPLARYAVLVLEANSKFNLTGARSVDEFVPHILDSLTVVPYIRGPYIDIGSGAGLPGVPVAVATGVATTLLEATAKKAAFLKESTEALGLSTKVRIMGSRAEDIGRDPGLREHFSTATIRAVAGGPAAVELASPLIAIGGLVVLQRGQADLSVKAQLARAAEAVGCTVEAEIPLNTGRRLVLIRKVAAVSEEFPRRTGMAQKRPLA